MRLKWLLQRMLEWQARARCGEQHDVWFRGRFLEQWADASAVGELHAVFAHYDEQDIWRALFATMTLFRRLAVETASLLGYAYPQDGDLYATELVEELFCDRQFAGAQ